MDFYAYQATARRQSRLFVVMFMAAVAAVVIALDAVIFTVLAARSSAATATMNMPTNARDWRRAWAW